MKPSLHSPLGLLGAIAALLVFNACDVVDESEIGIESGVVPLGFCGPVSAPLVLSSDQAFSADPSPLPNLYDDFTACGITNELDGTEGFFSINMLAGERYTISANPLNDKTDLAIYSLPTCDFRTCDVAANNCGAGEPEQLSIRATEDQTRFIGLDATNPGPLSFSVRRTVCGNDVFEIGEACDDGPKNSLDGDCSPDCRLTVRDGENEREPNDNKLAENLFLASVGTTKVSGQLTGACDVDRFAFTVDKGTSINARLLAIGSECAAPAKAELLFADLDDPVRATSGTAPSDEMEPACLTLADMPQMTALPAGEYQLVVRTPRGADGQLLTYTLEITATK